MPKQSYIVTVNTDDKVKDNTLRKELRKALTGHKIWADKACGRKASTITKVTVRPIPNDK